MPDRIRLDLPVLLPDVPDPEDPCVNRLTTSLQGRAGITRAHVSPAGNGTPDRLCVHYDPDTISLSHIHTTAESLGSKITNRYGHFVRAVRGISPPGRAGTIAERLRQIEGVVEAKVHADERVRVEYNRSATDESEIHGVLRSMGVRLGGNLSDTHNLSPTSPTGEGEGHNHPEEQGNESGHDHSGIFGQKTELIFAIIAGACVAVGVGLSFAEGGSGWLPWSFYLGGYAFGGYYTVREAVATLRRGDFEVDFLMLVAAAGAAVLGKWLEGAFLLFLFSLGHALEHYAMGQARQAIESLAELAPDTALVRRNGHEQEISVHDLRPGDTVIVKPNERIPADGFVADGESAVNQAPVTGESAPVEKTPVENPDAVTEPSDLGAAHRVYAGTINGSGALAIRVTKRAEETTISRVVQMVSDAEKETSPTEQFTHRFEHIFVPAVLGVVVLLLFAWIPLDETVADSFYRAMAVLVAASPCALAIATPSAVLSGIARAGREGVLVKGGGPLERLGELGAVAFDKTGTLTEGEPRVTEVVPHARISEDELLRVAAALESRSDHPLAESIVQHARQQIGWELDLEVDGFENISGWGVTAQVHGEQIYVGKKGLFEEVDGPPLPSGLQDAVDRLEGAGRTTVVVRRGQQYLGAIGLLDAPRVGTDDVVRRLRQLGIRRMIIISGDHQRVVDAVAKPLGIDEAQGDLLPDDKVEAVRALRAEEDVAMVGDGVNDAPAMANATVGIAMGAAGSDTALETADVALMADKLARLPFVVGLSRQTRRIIRQNLWIALGMVALLVPATIFGLKIGPAVAFHEGSTLLVVANALRQLRYAP